MGNDATRPVADADTPVTSPPVRKKRKTKKSRKKPSTQPSKQPRKQPGKTRNHKPLSKPPQQPLSKPPQQPPSKPLCSNCDRNLFRLQQTNTELATLQTTLKTTQQQCAYFIQQNVALKQQVQQLQDEVDRLNTKLAHSNELLHTQTAVNVQLRRSNAMHEEQLAACHIMIETHKNTNGIYQQTIETHVANIEKLTNKLDSLETKDEIELENKLFEDDVSGKHLSEDESGEPADMEPVKRGRFVGWLVSFF
ncbi:hypothetical protein OAM67_00905 [bacterium]|nr:hypothetical protein [bacterium]